MPTNTNMCEDNNYCLPAPVITFLKDQMKKLTWNITCDSDGFSQLSLTWRTSGVNMSVIHSTYKKKAPSDRRRDSLRKHDYCVERQNNK